MSDHTSSYDPDEEWDGVSGDDLVAALDFSPPSADDVADPVVEPSVEDGAADDFVVDEEAFGPLFSVTNPPGTLTVTAYISGTVQRVDLAPSVTGMTEAELARELLAIAQVAATKAKAGQYEYLLETTPENVGEREFIGDFLQQAVGLPTPEQAAQVEADFVQRYLRDDG